MALSRPLSRPLSSALSRPLTGVAESRPRISGFAFPGEELTGEGAGQWYVDGVAVPGKTGPTYEVMLTDIGKLITQEIGGIMSSAKECWHPRHVPQVVSCRVAYAGVLASVGPDVPAVPEDSVRRWVDVVNGYVADQTNASEQPTLKDDGVLFVNFDGSDDFLILGTPAEWTSIHGASSAAWLFAGSVENTGNATPISLVMTGNIRIALRSDAFQYRKATADTLRTVGMGGYQEAGPVVLYASASTTREITRKNGVTQVDQSSYSADVFDASTNTGRIGDLYDTSPNHMKGRIYCTSLIIGDISARDLSRMERFAMLCMGGNYAGPDIPLVP